MQRIGLRLSEARLPIEETTALVRQAEEQGYETLFVPEGSGREVFAQLATFACATSRVRLAPGIATIFGRTAPILAQAAATLDEVSGGRAVLGLGTGHEALVTTGHGVSFERPLARMRDYVALIRAIWRGEAIPPTRLIPVRRFRLERSARPDIAIYLAAIGPRMCRLAGEIADGVLLSWVPPTYIEEVVGHIRDGAERAGRDPDAIDIACYIHVAAGAPEAELREACARQIALYMQAPFFRAMFDQCGLAAHTSAVIAAYAEDRERASHLVPDAVIESLAVLGGAEAVRARLDQYRAMGVSLPVVAPVPAGPDIAAAWREAIDLP